MPNRAALNAADTHTIDLATLERGNPLAGVLELGDPPSRLFVRGAAPHGTCWIAIVGSRAASPYGCTMAARLAADLARLEFPIVSGLARGIDATAHQAALAAGGRTVAVLPGGVDTIVPSSHMALAESIRGCGALMSEFETGPPFGRPAFVRRNRLIAAMASAVVVVEAARVSGALSTAGFAAKLGRPVLAVPGDVDRPTSEGPLMLLRAGARPCAGARDVLAAIGLGATAKRKWTAAATTQVTQDAPTRRPDLAGPSTPTRAASSNLELVLLELLNTGSHTVEGLARAAKLDVSPVLRGLLALEWSGLARSLPGGRWCRTEAAE